MVYRIATILASVVLGLVAAHSLGAWADGYPTIRSPHPLPLVLVAFAGVPGALIAVGFSLLFLLWSLQLFRGQASIPDRSLALFIVSVGLSALLLAVGWRYGVKYQSLAYNLVCATVSVGATTTLAILWHRNRRQPSMIRALTFHVLLFAWLATYAFPYLGETP